jgi:hypothetical protein
MGGTHGAHIDIERARLGLAGIGGTVEEGNSPIFGLHDPRATDLRLPGKVTVSKK